MSVLDLIWLVVAIPLVSGLGLLVWGKEADRWGHLVATGASIASFVVGLVGFFALLGRADDDRSVSGILFTWIDVGAFHVDMAWRFDELSSLFVLLITGVGSLIHVYSIGYMEHDARRRRFFCYLNIFVAAMLTLVLADDYLVMFLGWEGVGLASFLLIGFWQHKPSASAAATKAFVINRVGDVGIALALMLMFAQFGTTSITRVADGVGQASGGVATALGLLLLLGACGKSAQVPLQAWLLDAMEGPTPVSALIHAATMVTAGVYLVVRSNAIYDATDVARTAVIVVGTVTLLVGAWIGCAKDDIKKALAGSTMSQIGYMMLAAGLGPAGYAFAIFHLITHGFFKANLFLGAGSVMHAMDDDVDMRRYGALREAMPVTFVTFALGYLAIIGFPGFSGFFSKDKIIEAAFGESLVVGLCALLGAGVTAFYMTRMMLMTFLGDRRWEPSVHPHESPRVMTVPLMILGAMSVLAGVLALGGWIQHWLEPVVGETEHHELGIPVWALTLLVVATVVVGVYLALRLYGIQRIAREAPSDGDVRWPVRAGRHELYGNTVNGVLVLGPTRALTRVVRRADEVVVDGLVRGLVARSGEVADAVRRPQTGRVRTYAATLAGGSLILVFALLAVALA